MNHLQVIISKQHYPYLNLAVETYLTENQEEGTVTMFLWKNERTVVIGLNQNPFAECDVRRLNDEGGHLMRRRTGGGAVYHDLGNLNFSFIADKKDYDVRQQLSVIQEALKRFQLEASISGRNDLLCHDRKFSGNAFFNGTKNNLHHGTILIKTDGEMMQRYLTVNKAKLQKHGVKSVASRVVNLSELADITSDNIVQPLIESFETVYGMDAEHVSFDFLAAQKEVQDTVKRITSHDYLYGKWEHFHTTQRQQFPWGNVDIQIEIDENQGIIKNANIASDCLDTDIIAHTESLLKGLPLEKRPTSEHPITNDILNLIFHERPT